MAVVPRASIPTEQLFEGVTHRFAINRSVGAPDCQMGEVVLTPGAIIPLHTHPVSDVMVVLAGHGRLTVGGEEFEIGPDMFLVAPPETPHALANPGTEDLRIVFTWPSGDPVPRNLVAEPDPR